MTTPPPFDEDRERAKECLLRLQKTMKEQGLNNIIVHYNGSGDSGYVEQAFRGPVDQGDVIQPDYDSGIWKDVEDAALSVLTYNYPGWEINDGSRGEIEFKLTENGKISAKIRHEWMEYVEQPEVEGVPEDMHEDNHSPPSP